MNDVQGPDEVATKPGDIDRTTAHEMSAPFMDRVETIRGLVSELVELHRLVVEQRLLPAGSDIAQRFSLLTGMVSGTLWRLDDEREKARSIVSAQRDELGRQLIRERQRVATIIEAKIAKCRSEIRGLSVIEAQPLIGACAAWREILEDAELPRAAS